MPTPGASGARKIVVISSASGNGKTTLGRELAGRLNLQFVELDALVHGPAWTELPDDELRSQLTPILATDGWVIDGSYERKLGRTIFDAAELVVWLDLPLHVWSSRLVRRSWRRWRGREELWNGNRESLKGMFWGRESLFLYALRGHFRKRRKYPEYLSRYNLKRLRTTDEVARFRREWNINGEL
jgi:adenylate kinase family enzyme